MTATTLFHIASELSGYNPEALPVSQAQRIIKEFVRPIMAPERATLQAALGRVLAEDVISPINVPAHDNSAMDGYAFRSADTHAGMITLKVVGAALAGHRYDGRVGAGECVRIMTGAVMPADCDTVVPQELVKAATDTVITLAPGVVKNGDNRRMKGEDLTAGKPALHKGKLLRAADLGLLASLGIGEVWIQRRLRVAIFSSGDELRSVGESLDEGCIYDSNRYTIYGMLTCLGCDVIDMGVVKDDPVSLEAALHAACEKADAIITSGGASVGDADYTAPIMAKLGDVMFWKLAMRPGKPMAFGRISSDGSNAYLFGLPGNPVAAMVTFYFLVRGALLRMMGAERVALPLMRATSQTAIRKKPGRTEYQRGIVSSDENGMPQVRITGAQGSGILRSMSEANAIVVLHHDQGEVMAGEAVDVMLFDGLAC